MSDLPVWETPAWMKCHYCLVARGFKHLGTTLAPEGRGQLKNAYVRVRGEWRVYMGNTKTSFARNRATQWTWFDKITSCDVKALRAKLDELGIKEEE